MFVLGTLAIIGAVAGAAIGAAGGAAAGSKIGGDRYKKEHPESIVILGMKGAGKSTLWEKLGGPKSEMNTEVDAINKFKLKLPSSEKIWVEHTQDIGGQTKRLKMYEGLIKPLTKVFFLVDATELEDDEYVQNICKYLATVRFVFDKNSTSEDFDNKIQIVVTHSDEYLEVHPEQSSESISQYCLERIDNDMEFDFGRLSPKGKSDIFISVNLLDEYYIKKLKNKINQWMQ